MQTITIIPLSKIFCGEIQDIREIRKKKNRDEKVNKFLEIDH